MTGIVERVKAERSKRAYPAPNDLYVRQHMDRTHEFQPPEYEEYIATSNDVYTAVQLRARAIAGLPLKLGKGRGKNRKEVEAGPSRDLFDSVNPFWTWRRLIHMHQMSLGLWGEGFWALETGNRNPPSKLNPLREIWWMKATKIRPVPHPQKYLEGFIYTTESGEEIPFEVDEIFWDRYPNPIDEFEGLSPLAAARLGADVGHAAMLSNRNLFRNGLQIGGLLVPKTGDISFSPEQAADLELMLDKRFRGVDKAHKWGVLRFEAAIAQAGITPKDAEFVKALDLSLRQVANAYGIPLPMLNVMEHATMANVEAYDRQLWDRTLIPDADGTAAEITEQILPRLSGDVDEAWFDYSEVRALQEGEDAKWTRAVTAFDKKLVTREEARGVIGLDPTPTGSFAGEGDEPTDKAEAPAPAPKGEDNDEPTDEAERRRTRMTYGGPEHVATWQRTLEDAKPWEERISVAVRGIFERQLDSVLDRLRAERSKRSPEEAAAEPFDRARWVKEFRVTMRPLLAGAAGAAGARALLDLGVDLAFDVDDPSVIAAMERQVQRFATEVNDTTWRKLRAELVEAIAKGEAIPDIETRVRRIMAGRIESSAEAIARTEVTAATGVGNEAAWIQSRVVTAKRWVAALDERTRDSHVAAHGQSVALGMDFSVGAGSGPAPGSINRAEEVVNCRCTMAPVVE